MARDDNLIPFDERTEEEQREIRSKGGKASGVARRKKRDAKSAAKLILELPTTETVTRNLEALGLDNEEDYTNIVAMMARAFLKAMGGDVNAMNFLVEMAGISPKFKLEVERHKRTVLKEDKSNNAVDDWISAVKNASKTNNEKDSDR